MRKMGRWEGVKREAGWVLRRARPACGLQAGFFTMAGLPLSGTARGVVAAREAALAGGCRSAAFRAGAGPPPAALRRRAVVARDDEPQAVGRDARPVVAASRPEP